MQYELWVGGTAPGEARPALRDHKEQQCLSLFPTLTPQTLLCRCTVGRSVAMSRLPGGYLGRFLRTETTLTQSSEEDHKHRMLQDIMLVRN